jgi:hypothetical protein
LIVGVLTFNLNLFQNNFRVEATQATTTYPAFYVKEN